MNEATLDLAAKIKQECFKCHPHAAFEALAVAVADIVILQVAKEDHDGVVDNLARNVRDILRMSGGMIDYAAALKEK